MSTYTPHPLALPPSFSPDTLDVLTELSDVLQKVHESARESLQRDSGGDQQTQTQSQSQQQPQSQQQSKHPQGQTPAAQTPASQQQLKPPGGSSGGGSTGAAAVGGAGKKLTFKDVPGATDGIKHKLQRARVQIRALPDMNRTVDEQRQEIAELEARIEKQRALLERLREGGLAFGKEAADRMET
jgi:hypothetical protein